MLVDVDGVGCIMLASASDGTRNQLMMQTKKPPDDLMATMIDAKGRTVWLTDERWDHILEGHPELRTHFEALKKAVETADTRTRGNWPDMEKLWGRNLGVSKWFVVVVAYDGQVGRVRTAICCKKGPKQQEMI